MTAPATCRECNDLEAAAWRRWAARQLGDAPTGRAATDQDLRRLLADRLRGSKDRSVEGHECPGALCQEPHA